jgi:hypothetical protein
MSSCGFLSPLKIHRTRRRLNPRTLGPTTSTLTTRPPKTTQLLVAHLLKDPPPLEPQGSLSYSKQAATELQPKPEKFIPHPHNISLWSKLILPKAVSRRPLTTQAQVCARVSPCWICGGQNVTGTGFSPSSSLSPVNIIPPLLSIPIHHIGDEQKVR